MRAARPSVPGLLTLLAIIIDDPVTRWAGIAGIAVGLA
jgi:hypothetical protein